MLLQAPLAERNANRRSSENRGKELVRMALSFDPFKVFLGVCIGLLYHTVHACVTYDLTLLYV